MEEFYWLKGMAWTNKDFPCGNELNERKKKANGLK